LFLESIYIQRLSIGPESDFRKSTFEVPILWLLSVQCHYKNGTTAHTTIPGGVLSKATTTAAGVALFEWLFRREPVFSWKHSLRPHLGGINIALEAHVVVV
jgi:hypothetical protein